MSILRSLTDRFSGGDAAAPAPTADATPPADAGDASSFDAYKRLDAKGVIESLYRHTQVELAEIEEYERANQNRLPVLDKLRYMRGNEPLAGYDGMTTEQVLAGILDADLETARKVRGYERKFRNRPPVLDAVIKRNLDHGVGGRRVMDTPAG